MRNNLEGKVKVDPEQAMKAQSRHIGTAIHFLNLGIR